MLSDLLFFGFAGVLLISALGVITAKNPMYCVLFMILSFFNAAGLFVLMGAEFLGLLMIMVYVGAIAVMFLFVLMTIDIDFAVLKKGMASYVPIGVIVGGVLFFEILAALWSTTVMDMGQRPLPAVEDQPENMVQLGHVLFTEYVVPFESVAMILLIAMIGAIVLTHRRREGVRRQSVVAQIRRKREDSLAIVSPKLGAGATPAHYKPKSVEKE